MKMNGSGSLSLLKLGRVEATVHAPVGPVDGAELTELGADEETELGGGCGATDVVAAPGRHCE